MAAVDLLLRPAVPQVAEGRGWTAASKPRTSFVNWSTKSGAAAAASVAASAALVKRVRQRHPRFVVRASQFGKVKRQKQQKSAQRSLVIVAFIGAAACTAVFRMFHYGSGRANWGTFAERMRAYHGVCGSLAADLAFSCAAFVAFAVCAGTETAITTLWPWKVREYAQREWEKAEQRVREMREGGGKRVTAKVQLGKWTALREDIQRFMQTILIGATLAGVVSTAFITEICGQLFGPKGLGIATVSVTLVQLTLGEILPKSMAVSNPYNFAQVTLPFFYRVSAVVYPVSKVLNEAVSLLLAMIGVPVDTNKTPFVSEEELDLVFRSAMQSGVVAAEEGEMIASVRNLDSKKIKEIMTPLVDMICIESEEPIAKLHHLIKATQFSRIPVYEVRFDNIIGVVSMKTLLKNADCLEEIVDSNSRKVSEIIDTAIFVPETMSLIAALRLLKERTLAVCVDEYGGTTGLITLEDVLEEIVGEIYDPDEEKDQVERQQNRSKIQQIAPDQYSMSGLAEKYEVEEALGIKMPEGDYNSIGGFMCTTIDRIPYVGEACTVETSAERIRFEISKVDERRVLQVEAFRSGKDGKEPKEYNEEDEERDKDLEKHQVIFVEVDVQDVQDATYQEDSDKLTEESTVTSEGERAERAEGEDIKSPSETALELDALDALDAPAVGVPPKPTETEASKASVASAAEAASEAWPMPPTAPTVKPTEVKGTKDTVAKASSDPTDLKETKKDGKYAKEKKGGKEEKKDT